MKKHLLPPKKQFNEGFFIRSALLFIFILIVQIQGFASPFFGQDKRNFEISNLTVKEAIKFVLSESNYKLTYALPDFDDSKHISMSLKNVKVEDALNMILDANNLTYTVKDNNIIISKKQSISSSQEKKITIKGRVVDFEKEPLSGVDILIKGTTIGTTTNVNGEYSINVNSRSAILIFRFLGMKTEEVPVKNRAIIDVVMEDSENILKDVVVTGMFTRKAESFTGSITSIKGEDLLKLGNQNLIVSIKNIEPSFVILEDLEVGSNPNILPNIELRGTSSFPDLKEEFQSNPNLPLFILDGFEASLAKVIDFDMNLIESVTILKDATAKAIYGSKAANGVVVIETKKLEGGALRVSYTGSMNVEIPILNVYDLCNAREKLDIEYQRGRYNNVNPVTDLAYKQIYNELLKEVERGVNTYWLSKPVRSGFGNKHTFTVEGGDKTYTYSLYLSSNNIKGSMNDSDRNTLTGGVSIGYRHSKLLLKNQLNITYNKASNPSSSFSEYLNMNPYWRDRDESGKVTKEVGYFGRYYYNPEWDRQIGTFRLSNYLDITNNFNAEYRVTQNLKIVGRFNVSKQINESDTFLPPSHSTFLLGTSGTAYRGSYTYAPGKSLSVNGDINLSWSSVIKEKSLIFINLGSTISEANSESLGFTANGFPYDKMNNMLFAQELTGRPSGRESTVRDLGLVGVFNYSYSERYLADFSFRTSGSSQFGSNNRWGKFWALGAGWNVHKEKFMANVKKLRQLKLRASLGYTGSQNFNAYQAIATYNYQTSSTYRSGIGASLIQFPNYDLAWQQKLDYNIGIDIDLVNKLSFKFDYYLAFTNNLLTDITIAPSLGFETMKENMGKIKNTGAELRVQYFIFNNPTQRKSLSINFAAATNKNVIIEISDALRKYNESADAQKTGSSSGEADRLKYTRPAIRFSEGQSINGIWAVRSKGIDPATGNELFINPYTGEISYTWDANNQVIIGDTRPLVTGNFGLNFEYKGFNLNTSLGFKYKGYIYNTTLVNKVENANIEWNVDRRIFTDRWRTPGQIAPFKRISDGTFTKPTSRFVQEENQLTINTINISYDFRYSSLIKKLGMQRLRVSAYTNNLFTFSTVKIERGTSYPFSRNFSLSISANF